MDNTALLRLFSGAVQSVASQNGLSMGLIILAIIEMPVVILILASVISRPRRLKVTGLFLGWLLLVFAIFVGAIYVISFIFGLFF
jgi:hypothetical protein